MMRSSQPRNEINVPASAVSPRPPSISGVCSECGTTYQVAANGGDETWSCPRCGPSMPIAAKESAAPPRRKRRAHTVWPRIRIPFFLVQILVVSLTFTLFLTSVLYYMNRFPGRHARTAGQVTQAARPSSDLPRDPIVRHSGIVTDGNTKHDSGDPGNSAASDVAASDVAASDVAASEMAGRGQSEPAPESAAAELHVMNSSDETVAKGVVAAPLTTNATTATAQDVLAAETDWPIAVVANSLTVREIFEDSYRMFGREFVMQCKLVQIHEDAEGKVPNRFELEGQSFTLTDAEEARFVRLEVLDVQGERLHRLFARAQGKLQQELKWVLPGDWIVITATVGLRYDNDPVGTGWGVILTDIAALQEDTYDTQEAAANKL